MNPTIVLFIAGLALASSAEIIQGPSVRTVNVGPDGSIIDSLAAGGTVVDGATPLLTPPSLRTIVSPSVGPAVVAAPYYGAPLVGAVPLFARSFYEPAFYPYGKTVVAGPSGTIIA